MLETVSLDLLMEEEFDRDVQDRGDGFLSAHYLETLRAESEYGERAIDLVRLFAGE